MKTPDVADGAALRALTHPERVAIIGASDDPVRIGGRPLHYMLQYGFAGEVLPVNPNRSHIQGLPAYPELAAIEGEIDFALIAVRAPLVADTLRQAAAKGAKAALIFSSGFAEIGADGMASHDDLENAVRETGIAVLGPNCLGLFHAGQRFFPTFSATIAQQRPRPGGVAVIAQSGAYGSHIYMCCHRRGLDVGTWITTGNEVGIGVADCISMIAEAGEAHTILAYIEEAKSGPALINALETARQQRIPVVISKVGTSAVGAAAAQSHTASLAGEDAAYDAIFRQYGAFRVASTEEMVDVAVAARPRLFPVGRKVGLVSISGGGGIVMADAASACGLDVAPMPAEAQLALKSVLPFATPFNPVDVTAQFFNDLSLIPLFIRTMLETGGYDGLVGFWTSVVGAPAISAKLRETLTETMAGYPDIPFLQVMLAEDSLCRQYDEAGFPTFADPGRAVFALAALAYFGASFAATRDGGDQPLSPAMEKSVLPALLGERQARAILASHDIPMVADGLAHNAKEAAELAAAMDGPVAMKIASADIAHKTDIGGVRLNVAAADAASVFSRMMAEIADKKPDARLDGVLVSPMVEDGVDLILGGRIDAVFGPMVLVGIGGIHAELLGDVVLRHAPVDTADAAAMLDQLKLSALLDGARGAAAVDRAALTSTIAAFSRFLVLHADQLETAEINPLRALPDGCIGLDALIVPRIAGGETS